MTSTVSASQARFLADVDPPVCSLAIGPAWAGLTEKERQYAHWMSEASWKGARIIAAQTSPSSPLILDLLLVLFSSSSGTPVPFDALSSFSDGGAGLSAEEFSLLTDYAAQVISNLANYRSFGATKFIPRLEASKFEAFVRSVPRAKEALELWSQVKEEIYSLSPEAALSIGHPSEGHTSGYYPTPFGPAPTNAEVDAVQAAADKAGVSTLNTRLQRSKDGKGLELLVASEGSVPGEWPKELEVEGGQKVRIVGGDFAAELGGVIAALEAAKGYAASATQERMLEAYVRSFQTGDIEAHKKASEEWVKDVGPVVETYVGFIEAYVDPFGARAEWEGFVAVVNKEQSKKFEALVNRAEELVPTLPWGKDFEVPVFKRPDFTALEILSFATGGIPAGINIPNYHDVRETTGFKNVSLSNILSAKAKGEKVTFIPEGREADEYEKWEGRGFEMQVANHELLGHGTGRLLSASSDGTLNFDRSLVNPLTGKAVSQWYQPGETYGSKTGSIAASMEECRAEAVALYLASNEEILGIFGVTEKEEKEKMVYYTFLVMARAGLRALEWFDPTTNKHGQAHMEARLGITNWLLRAGIASIEEVKGSNGEVEDLYVRVDKEKALKEGKEVVGRLLLEIQVRKSTGDAKGATEFYKSLTTPLPRWVEAYRPIVLAKKTARKVFVQPLTVIGEDGKVELKEYEVTKEGVIRSAIERGI